MSEPKFLICETCGKLVGVVNDSRVPLMCCGKPMKEIIPGTVEAAAEKHIPVVTVDGKTVKVDIGSVAHPMTEAHLIQWVYLQTAQGGQRKILSAEDAPVVTFALTEDDTPIAAYAYCNLHGLWKAEI
ncbi:MAG: desulfoferrodoxin [Oscillospiraceae bacterium]|nr:desulfoferrodoxin [Oscillospiraceae bacterium]